MVAVQVASPTGKVSKGDVVRVVVVRTKKNFEERMEVISDSTRMLLCLLMGNRLVHVYQVLLQGIKTEQF